MASIAALKDLKRRGLQNVLQKMGIAEKTNDETHSQAYHNFDTLGNFLTHFKQSVQGASSSLEKMTKLQSSVASNVQAYLHSELSGDTEAPTGELQDFFLSQDEEAASTHSVMLQEVAERFYYACNDITNSVLQSMLHGLDDLVIKPITRDEELNIITKEFTEERKRLNLDYDSYRRAAQAATTPSEQERLEAKLRAAKERFDASSKRVNEHLALRNYNRSRIIIHTVLSLIQQYNQFFATSSTLFQEVTGVLTPLLKHYQMDERQFLEMAKQDVRPPKHTVKDGASVPAAAPAPKPAKQRSPSPPRSSPPQQQRAASVVPPKPANPVRSPSPPRTPPMATRDTNGYGTTNGAPPPKPKEPTKPKESPLVDGLMDDPPTSTSPPPTTSAPLPKTNSDFFAGWENSGPRTESFVDASFDSPLAPNSSSPTPHHSTPQTGGGGGLFDDPMLFGDFGKPSATPLKPQTGNFGSMPQPGMNKPAAPGSNFVPPQSSTFKPTPNYNVPPQQQPFNSSFPNVPPQPNYNMPHGKPATGFGFPPQPGFPQGNFGSGFPPQPGFQQGNFGGPPAGHGGYPPRPNGPQYGGGFPPGGNPYANNAHPNAGAIFEKQTDSDGLDPAISSKIRLWAEKGGKKTNLRGLICTMHEVLWAESGWEQKGLGELVSPAQVKKAYRQATLIVHPDKVTSCTDEQKLMAKRVFECLRESYETFKNEPQ